MAATQHRIYYAIQAVAVAPLGVTTFGAGHLVHGCQSVGVNTKFNLEQVFELGQLELYQQIDSIPDIDITLEKALDGYALVGHLATVGATDGSLAGRSNTKNQFAMSIFSDSQQAASGTPLSTVFCSGVYLQNWAFNFPTEGFHTEQTTLVGNNKLWAAAGITFTGLATNADAPSYSGGVARRWHIAFYPTGPNNTFTQLPTNIEGVSASGTNDQGADGNYKVHVQSIKTSANLGRDALYELGRHAAFFRYVQWPVETKTDIEIIGLTGDQVSGTEAGINADGTNLTNQVITVKSYEGTYVNLGTRNKLQSVTYGGGNAGGRGGNVMETYSFVGFNDFTVLHPADPSGFGGY